MSFSFRLKPGIARLASIVAITSILPLPALSIPVSNSAEFVTYLNSDQSWGNGYKFKFNRVSDCSKRHGSNGRVKAFVCTNGVVERTSPTGETSSCRVSRIRVNKKNKIKLTTSNCKYN
jgi:hypothetical protein